MSCTGLERQAGLVDGGGYEHPERPPAPPRPMESLTISTSVMLGCMSVEEVLRRVVRCPCAVVPLGPRRR